MTKNQQMPLPLAFVPAQSAGDFVQGPQNQAAYDAITKDRREPLRLAISGPPGAGKSHLASIWGKRTGAVRLNGVDLTDEIVASMPAHSAIVIEAADMIADQDGQRLLFHALNLTQAENVPLLLTGRTPPARWQIGIPDLVSRVQAMQHIAISEPDDTLLSSILAKLFADRQMTVGEEVVNYLVLRMERSFAAAERTVEQLDRLALAKKRPITRPLAAELFEMDLKPDEP